jgi:hypothetical protein
VEGVKSTTAPVHSGVPQGSVLAQLLFLLYINDLPDAVSEGSTMRLFTDDCALHMDIKTTEDARSGGFHSFQKNLLCATFKEIVYPLVSATFVCLIP